MTHNAACRFADKSGNTIITSLDEDDTLIMNELSDEHYYRILEHDNTPQTIEKVLLWAEKWKGRISKDVKKYVSDIIHCKAGKCKPFTKTHKPKPWPIRLLLSGCGTPVHPLSKFVQQSICHLVEHIKYQVLDTKEVLRKMETDSQPQQDQKHDFLEGKPKDKDHFQN